VWKELLRTFFFSFALSHGGAAGWREGCADQKSTEVHEKAWDSAWKKRDRGGKEREKEGKMQIR
jgi:hypothetical protein